MRHMHLRIHTRFTAAITACVLALAAPHANAEVSEIKIARGFGIGYLALMVMEQNKLVEKHVQAQGLKEVAVSWQTLGAGTVMNDALLSGSLHFAAGGVPPFLTLWGRTRGNLDVKAVGALSSMPLFLNTRDAAIKSIRDYSDKNKIALAGPKSGIHAIVLQMAVAREFGDANFSKLDPLTVNFAHPDGMAAFLSGGEITSHFTSPPFQYLELERAGVRTVLNSYDVLGGPATFLVVWATGKFRDENPKSYAAFAAALEEATDWINRDKRAAAELYLRVSKDKDTVEGLLKLMNDPAFRFTLAPENTMKFADFMFKIGTIKQKAASWKDLFFPNVYNLPGS